MLQNPKEKGMPFWQMSTPDIVERFKMGTKKQPGNSSYAGAQAVQVQ